METTNNYKYYKNERAIFNSSGGNYNSNYKWQYFLYSFKNNQKFRKALAITALVCIVTAILVVTALYHLVVRLIDIPRMNA
jgi:hypothetical protein